MSFLYPSASATGLSGAVGYMVARMAAVTASPSFYVPVPTGTDGFLRAMVDSLMGVLGFQAGLYVVPGASNNGGSSSYADVAGAQMVWTPPATKVYEFDCDFNWFRSSGTGNGVFRLVVGSADGAEWEIVPASSNTNVGPHRLSAAVFCVAGTPLTIKLQWKSGGTATLNFASTNACQFAIRG